MNAFDKVIGYSAIKKELMQICDMVKNPEEYEALAQLPKLNYRHKKNDHQRGINYE